MRIGIDAHILGKQKGGVETYVYSAIRSLASVDYQNEYFIYVTQRHPLRQAELPANFHIRKLAVSTPWIQRSILIPYLYRRDRLDVIHLQRALPLWGCGRTVVHMHDAAYVTNPRLFPAWKRTILTSIFRRSGRKAAAVITGTQTSRDEIIRCFKVDPSKIVIIPDGVDRSAFYPVRSRSVLTATWARLNVRPPYAIFLGALERNKNVDTLIRAFAQFRGSYPDFMLVILGKWRHETKRGYTGELKELVRELGIEASTAFTGYVSDEDRRALLTGASMLVFPSTAEGFGLPPLEAMACGVPAILADTPVALEVYGDAALTVPPVAESLAGAMLRLAEDDGLRQGLIEKGLELAKVYSWECTGKLLLDVYRSVARCNLPSSESAPSGNTEGGQKARTSEPSPRREKINAPARHIEQ